MSWEAVTWASKQRMKLPHEQLILLVLANCADPNGEAFAKWPGREHWWKYLADRTRLSKSSLFRHINTLIELGLCDRSMMVLDDGTRRPTIRLDLSKDFDIDEFEALHSQPGEQSHGETGEDEASEEAENDNDFSNSQRQIERPQSQSHGETGPTSGTDPFPIMGTHKDSSLLCSKELPPTPQGGPSVVDDGFEDFRKAWLRPIDRPSIATTAWGHIPSAKRGEVIAAAKGYFVWIGKQRKDHPVVSAQTFLRESSGWAQWLAYVPDASGTPVSVSTAHPLGGREGRAIVALHEIAGIGDYLRSVMIRAGHVNFLRPVTTRLLALADAGPKHGWGVLNRNQAAAWEGLLRETVTVQVRKHLKEGDRAPWPWPPRKDGTLSPDAPGPTMTADDVQAFANEGMR